MQQKSLVWVNFFWQKVLGLRKFSTWLVCLVEKIAFLSPLNYDRKVGFDHFRHFRSAVYNTGVTLELPRRCSWLHWNLLTPFMRLVRHANPYGVLEGRYKNTCCNYGKIRSYAVANTFYPSKQICSSILNTPNSFIWLEDHFRPNIPRRNNENWASSDIFKSILVYFDGPTMVNTVNEVPKRHTHIPNLNLSSKSVFLITPYDRGDIFDVFRVWESGHQNMFTFQDLLSTKMYYTRTYICYRECVQ